MEKLTKIWIAIFLLLFCGQAVIAQPINKRPKVGLALSGGGSHGMAHVGVLKVMEEAGLRPDYITGVSMGSIIGGMYALGYSADSIHNILKDVNWNLSLSNNIEENKVIYPEKEHFNNSIISLPISSRKVRFPSGLISGQQIENLFSYYAWPSAGINDFSKLPIPFMCLAVDILTGKIVELHNGYLPDAMRASSAVPTFFAPIKIDSALLIDGGVLRNFAAEEARNMGADIVIGSYTGFIVYSEDELQSMPGIIKQIVFQRSHEDFQTQKKFTDLLIEPKVKEFPSTVFSNVDSLIGRGYKAALPYKEYFRKLADSLNRIGPQKPIENILDNQTFVFDKIEIEGNKLYSDNQILGVLGIAPGDKIDKNLIRGKIDLLYGKTWFEKVKYRISSRNDSLILIIDCFEQPKSMLYGGVYYDSNIRSGIVFRMTSKDLIFQKSFIDFDSFIGQYYRLKLSFLKYIDRNEKFGLSAVFYADNTNLPMIEVRKETGSASYRNSFAGVVVNKYLGLNQLMNISVNLGNSSFVPDFVSVNHLRKINYRYLSESYSYKINTLDTKHFPNIGRLFEISFRTSKLLSGKIVTDSYRRTYTSESPDDFLFKRSYSADADFKQYFSPNKKLTLVAGGNVLLTYTRDSVPSPNNYYFLGGLESEFDRSVQLTGFHSGEIPVQRYAGLKFGADFEFNKDLHLSLMTNVGLAREIGHDNNITILGGYGLGIGYMSIIGPLKIGFMHGMSSAKRYFSPVKGYLSIGFSY
jgi:NTE family protein